MSYSQQPISTTVPTAADQDLSRRMNDMQLQQSKEALDNPTRWEQKVVEAKEKTRFDVPIFDKSGLDTKVPSTTQQTVGSLEQSGEQSRLNTQDKIAASAANLAERLNEKAQGMRPDETSTQNKSLPAKAADVAIGAANAVTGAAKSVANSVSSSVSNVFTGQKNDAPITTTTTTTTVEPIWPDNKISAASAPEKSLPAKAADAAYGAANAISGAAKSAATTVSNTVSNATHAVGNTVSSASHTVSNTVTNAFASKPAPVETTTITSYETVPQGKSLPAKAADAALDAAYVMTGAAKSAASSVSNMFVSNTPATTTTVQETTHLPSNAYVSESYVRPEPMGVRAVDKTEELGDRAAVKLDQAKESAIETKDQAKSKINELSHTAAQKATQIGQAIANSDIGQAIVARVASMEHSLEARGEHLRLGTQEKIADKAEDVALQHGDSKIAAKAQEIRPHEEDFHNKSVPIRAVDAVLGAGTVMVEAAKTVTGVVVDAVQRVRTGQPASHVVSETGAPVAPLSQTYVASSSGVAGLPSASDLTSSSAFPATATLPASTMATNSVLPVERVTVSYPDSRTAIIERERITPINPVQAQSVQHQLHKDQVSQQSDQSFPASDPPSTW